MEVGNNGVILRLPALVVSNAAIKVAAAIVVDGVAVDFGEESVDIWWKCGWRSCGCGGVDGGIGQRCSVAQCDIR